MDKKIIHFLYCPFTGLGLYGGWRGERWFGNRIKIFKQFVARSLCYQNNENFVLWISFTNDQRGHKLVEELGEYLTYLGIKYIFTYSGVCFYDDKYSSLEARIRLMQSLHDTMGEMLDFIGEVDYVYMTIQPSDDCYWVGMVDEVQKELKDENIDAVGYKEGYIIDYKTLEMSDYNPKTNPPFYTIKFTRDQFTNPHKHLEYTALKNNVGGYAVGTPLPSHEYVGDCLRYKQIDRRGFLVGTHGENISTYYNHPFKGDPVSSILLMNFGLDGAEQLKINISLRKKILKKLPHKLQKKIRYLLGEKLWNKIYEFLRS